MPGVAILKPDHLGDLVLASPAIRAIRASYTNVTLFVAPDSVRLARYLFPEIGDVRPLALAHLGRRPDDFVNPDALRRTLQNFSFVFCLRGDEVLRPLVESLTTDHVIALGDDVIHETMSQKRAVTSVIGSYSRTQQFAAKPISWPTHLGHIALCIAAGFPTNRWPNLHWLKLAQHVAQRGIFVSLVGGPAERNDLAALSRMLQQVPHQVIEGGDDFGAFLDALADVDLVVATDGGTAHLCSLRKPICSVFGSSPWRRFAPFGVNNIIITRDEPCSPCVQFSTTDVNGCLTRECTALLRPSHVARVVVSNGIDLPRIAGIRVERGVSHLRTDRATGGVGEPQPELAGAHRLP